MARDALYLVGCPWTGLPHLRKELAYLVPDALVLSVDDIVRVSPVVFDTRLGDRLHVEEVTGCFLRYPYDLIPPFTATYAGRESIEWFKTLCLLLSDRNVNDTSQAWALRNRLMSLRALQRNDVPVPRSMITLLAEGEQLDAMELGRQPVAKSIGNCYVAEANERYPADLFSVEEDDGDHAVIFPSQRVTGQNLDLYRRYSDRVFLQRVVDGLAEYRCYCVARRWSSYRRQDSVKLDKSGCAYLATDWTVPGRMKENIERMMDSFGQGYACMDMIDADSGPVVIDYNPFGALPAYDEHPQTTRDLACAILGDGKRSDEYSDE